MIRDEILNSIKNIKSDKIYLVGGYIRNYLINNTISSDRDLVCLDNPYLLAQKIADYFDGTLIELDKKNEIYRVVLKDKINYFDITKAIENDIEKDAKRRDFTINSIYYDINEEKFIDYSDGLDDIKNKILKTAKLENFTDDPLRFLRLYRFYSLTGFKIDKNLNDYVIENFSLIHSVAPERINYEIMHMFEGEYIVDTLLKMYEDNTLEEVFPFVKEIKKVPSNSHHHLDLIHHSIETVKNIKSNKPLLKISAFYHDIGKPATWTIEPKGRHRFIGHDIKGAEIAKKELEKLKFSNKQISYITKMIKYHIYPASLVNCADSKKAFARFVKKLSSDAPDIIELSRADRLSARGEAVSKEMIEKSLSHLDNLLNYYNEVKAQALDLKPFIDGRKIMEILDIKPSKLVGELIDELKTLQLSGDIKTKDEAIDYIKNKAAKA